MHKLTYTLMLSAFTFFNYPAFAADSITHDAQEGLMQDETSGDVGGSNNKKSSNKIKKHNSRQSNHANKSMDYKSLDSNSDGMISKDEYMTHHETAYGKMKQTNGSVSLKDMNSQMNVGTTKGNKLQPSNPAGAAPEAKSSTSN